MFGSACLGRINMVICFAGIFFMEEFDLAVVRQEDLSVAEYERLFFSSFGFATRPFQGPDQAAKAFVGGLRIPIRRRVMRRRRQGMRAAIEAAYDAEEAIEREAR